MKQIVIFIIGLSLVLVGGLGEIYYIDKSSNYYKADIEYIKNTIDNNNFELARAQFENTYKSWENQKYIWNIFVYHEEVDDISQNVLELRHYLNIEDKDEAHLSAQKIIDNLDHTAKRQEIKIENVL